MNDKEREEFRAALAAKFGQTWDTAELQETYTVVGFCYGCAVVVRKSDGERGSLDFTHSPRFYHSFMKG